MISLQLSRNYDDLLLVENKLLEANAGPSEILYFRSVSSKSFLIMCASHFEREVKQILENGLKAATNNSAWPNFISKQVLARGYHALFDWDANNMNKFFNLFGESFKPIVTQHFENNHSGSDIASSARDFIFLGQQRNLMVHGDFASFNFGNTIQEVKSKFESAELIVESFRFAILELSTPPSPAPAFPPPHVAF